MDGSSYSVDNPIYSARKSEECVLAREDIVRDFTERHLASLTMQEYVDLLRISPSEMVTHVTRQGIRDHTGLLEHNMGKGEFWSGFEDILREGKIKPILSILTQTEKRRERENYLKLPIMRTKDAALANLRYVLKNEDYLSVHFSLEDVSDQYYGGERGNEIFFVFPAAFIASQCYFVPSLTERPHDAKHNNIWVWTQDGDGIDVNAGLVFIPADARVDPRTGSQYKIGLDGRPKINEEYKTFFTEITKQNGFDTFIDEVFKTYLQVPGSEQDKKIAVLQQTLVEKFHIRDPQLVSVIMNRYTISNYYSYFMDIRSLKKTMQSTDKQKQKILSTGIHDEKTERRLRNLLAKKADLERGILSSETALEQNVTDRLIDAGFYYKRAEVTISSQEYWEDFFTQSPHLRPKHLVYYTGGDSTLALKEFKEKNGITQKSAFPHDLGFPERRRQFPAIPEEVKSGYRRVLAAFETEATRTIDEYYSST